MSTPMQGPEAYDLPPNDGQFPLPTVYDPDHHRMLHLGPDAQVVGTSVIPEAPRPDPAARVGAAFTDSGIRWPQAQIVTDEPGKHAAPEPQQMAPQVVQVQLPAVPMPTPVDPAAPKQMTSTKALISYLGTNVAGLVTGLAVFLPEDPRVKIVLGILATFLLAVANGVTTWAIPNTEKK